jgi:mannose-6-phosphate isomerase-like protein (cupin superfamily)
MSEPVTLEKVNVAVAARQLREPFTMVDLAQIDDVVLSVYLCQGTMAFHRHLDQDELFLVHSGTISLESEWGTAILHTGEMAVVPKGVGHRSSSLGRSLVLILEPRLMVNRRNGDRRLFASKDEGRLEKINVPAVGHQIAPRYQPVTLTHLDTFGINLVVCEGAGPWWQDDTRASLVFCLEGNTFLDTDHDSLALEGGELVVVPSGVPYRLSGRNRGLIMSLQRPELH